MPAIVVGNPGHSGVAHFGFPGELGFGQGGHSDNVRAPGAVHKGFGFGGKGGAFHHHHRAAGVAGNADFLSGGGDNGAAGGAKGFGKRDVGNDAGVKKGADPAAGAVNKLVGDYQIQGGKILFQAADGADGKEPLHAQGFQGVDVGPGRNCGGIKAVAAAVARQKGHPGTL